MRSRTAGLFAAALALLTYSGISAHAQTHAPAALTGTVSSAEEGLMEGVVVSAKKGIVTVSVVSNDKGEFSFPASRPGGFGEPSQGFGECDENRDGETNDDPGGHEGPLSGA